MTEYRHIKLSRAESMVADAVGRLAELLGLRRNLGRIWAVLYCRGRSMTAAEVRRLLDVSTGAVSMTLRELQRWGVTRRVWKPGERQKLYLAELDVWRVVGRVLRSRLIAELDAAIDQLERALTELRRDFEVESGERERAELEQCVGRVEDLLDLFRMLSSLLRLLAATGKLDATTLASFRLGGDESAAVEIGRPRT